MKDLDFRIWLPLQIRGSDKRDVDAFINRLIPPVFSKFDSRRYRFFICQARDNMGRTVGVSIAEVQTPDGVSMSDGYNLEINYIAVDPDFRGRGLAQLLIGQAITRAVLTMRKSPKSINGICKPDGTDFYKRIGFSVTEENMSLPDGVIPMNYKIPVDPAYPCAFWKMWGKEEEAWIDYVKSTVSSS